MFGPTRSPRSPLTDVAAALRRAAELTLAFATLESYDLDDLRPGRSTQPERQDARPELQHAPAFPEPAPDPHRMPLRSRAAGRRPGTTPRPTQVCTTPLAKRPTREHGLDRPSARTGNQR